ncbi:MAG: hypothetical protein AB7K52_09090 [Phycisphaerales bacterium]
MNAPRAPRLIPRLDAPALGVACAIFAGAWYALIEPARRHGAHSATLRAELADVEAMAVSSEGSIRIRDEGTRALRAELADLGVRLQPATQLNHRVQELTELAGVRGIRVEQIRPGSPESDAVAVAIPIKLMGQSGYAQVQSFLSALRKRFPDVSVSGLKMQRGSAPLDQKPVAAMIEFDLAWHALPAGSAGAARAAAADSP